MPKQSKKKLTSLEACLLLAALFCFSQSALADTYQFDVNTELAVASPKKIDPEQLKNMAMPGIGVPQIISRDAEPVWKPPEKSTLTVSTGPDSLYVQSKEFTRVYDFKSKKIYELDAAAKTCSVHSLFGELAYRNAELRNRMMLSDMMSKMFKGQKQGKFFDKFFSEEMFSLCLPEKNSGYKLSKTRQGNEDSYSYAGAVVSTFLPSANALSSDKRRQFSRYLIYATHLHPSVRVDIEKSGKLPQKFMYFLDNPPVNKERKTLVLKNVSPGNYFAAVPEGYRIKTDPKDILNPVYARIAQLGGKPPADLKEQTIAYYDRAVEKKNYFDALLAITEYGLQTGENLAEKTSQIKGQIKDDPDCQKFIAGLATPEGEQQAILSLGSLDMIDRSRSPKSYLVDIFRANLLVKMAEQGMHDVKTSLEKDPVKAFVSVLEHNPFIAGVYHDLGNLLEQNYLHINAWDCYDMARKFYPQHPFMEEIKEKEDALSSQFPQFFSGDKI